MDRYLKERMVGAAVLVAAAIIFIPEMLSGPKPDALQGDQTLPGRAQSDEGAVKTYTIDLAANKEASKESQHNKEVAAPQIAEAIPPAQPSVSQENRPADATAPGELPSAKRADEKSTAKPTSVVESHSETPKPAEKTSEAKPAPVVNERSAPSAANRATSPAVEKGAWAVQVGSFGARATSERIAEELKSKGFPAFVTATTLNNQTVYRVRVGPVAQRQDAEELLKKVKPLYPTAAVAAQ